MRTASALIISLLLLSHAANASSRVYLVHGYGSHPIFMGSLERQIKRAGYETTNFGYNSLIFGIDSCARMLYHAVKKSDQDSVHFVTHSMGGLVVRALLAFAPQDSQFPVISRIVMLAPPNRGAEIADFFASVPALKWILGPNLEYMKTDSNSYANKLPIPENSDLGVIAGARFDTWGYNPFIKGDNDGYVSPERARLGAEKEFIMVPEAHMLMTQSRTVKKYVVHFLKSGNFAGKSTAKTTGRGLVERP